jgi:hypothetical protein
MEWFIVNQRIIFCGTAVKNRQRVGKNTIYSDSIKPIYDTFIIDTIARHGFLSRVFIATCSIKGIQDDCTDDLDLDFKVSI